MPTLPTGDDATAEQEAEHQSLLSELQEERTRTPLRPVYHYTGDVGLFEILKSGHLWLSDYTTLNDPSELQHGVKVGTDVLNASVAAQGNQTNHLQFIQGFNSVAGLSPVWKTPS